MLFMKIKNLRLRHIIIFLFATGVLSVPLNAATHIRIAVTEWPPYTSEHLPGNGILCQTVRRAFSAVGIRVKYIWLPWKRALSDTADGKYDALLGANRTAARMRDFIFPGRGFPVRTCLISRADYPKKHLRSLRQFAPARVGILLGSLFTDRFRKIPGLEIDFANSIRSNLAKLLYGRIDLLVEDPRTIAWLQQKHFPGTPPVITVGTPVAVEPVYCIFPRRLQRSPHLSNLYRRGIYRTGYSGQ